jgi:hypothetical protein
MTDTYTDARQIISRAITAMEKAEDEASGSQQMVLLDIIEILRTERIKIDIAGLAASSKDYKALTDDIKQATKKLDALTEEIKQLIKRAEQAAQVAGALAKLVDFAARIAAG